MSERIVKQLRKRVAIEMELERLQGEVPLNHQLINVMKDRLAFIDRALRALTNGKASLKDLEEKYL